MKLLGNVLLLLAALAAIPDAAIAGGSIAEGRGGDDSTPIQVPRIEATTVIDGVLDEPAWSQAALLRDFYEFLPVDGRASEDSTHVLVWYAPTGIHFGIRAYETHGAVRANLADRDKIGADDHILLILDTFDDRRQAIAIGVNPLGSQADGICRDASRRVSNFGDGGAEPYRIDLNPDYVFESKGRLTPFGYEVEIFIPFKSLRYQTEDVQNWGFNVVRSVQHSGYLHAWTKIDQETASFLGQSGTLAGLRDLRRGLVLDVSPEMTSSVSGAPDGEGWKYSNPDLDIESFGGNVRWGVSNNLTLNATVNPDFSQVEADVAQISYDPRAALYFPEKRPFFLDGIELFSMPSNLIYTRRLSSPVAAVKLTGKVSGTNVGVISGVDRKNTSITGEDPRFFNAIRVSRDVWGQSTLGMAYTDKVDGGHSNRVASVDGRLVLGKKYTVTFQGSGSFTNDGAGTTFAPLWTLSVNQSGRRFGFSSNVSGIHGDFNAESGFIRRTNVAGANFSPRMTFFPASGGLVESITTGLAFDGTWTYDRFTAGKEPDDQKFHINGQATLRGGWSVGASLLIESFKYPPSLYRNYYVERHLDGAAVDTVAYVGTDRLANFDYVLNISSPQFDAFSGSFYIVWGRDENFQEWAPADIIISTLVLNWNPTDQLRLNLLYNHQQYIRPGDRSNVQIRRVPRLKVEYQLSRAIFLRVVGQYDSNLVDELRDNSRTEDPILLRDADGVFRRTGKTRTNHFRVDWLFSYRPTPGTVVFFGYGSSLSEVNSFRFRDLERLNDGFFMKLSYLIRA